MGSPLPRLIEEGAQNQKSPEMDAIRKKMQSLKAETDTLYATIAKFEEDTREREEKLVEKIYNLQSKYKTCEARFEYGEMNITKLNQRIDDVEDEVYREKLKVKKCSDELEDTFD